MKIGIVGFGSVGKAVANGFKNFGHTIYVYDVDENKLKEAKRKGYYITKTINEIVDKTKVLFICVPTPSNPDGSCNTSLVRNTIIEISKLTKEEKILVIKSTVIVGTTDKLVKEVNKINPKVKIVFNPEFLRNKHANFDFLHPDRIVIGAFSRKAINIVRRLYKPFNSKIVVTDPRTAEMIKYASNAFLATKVSFANQIRIISEKLKINPKKVMDVVVMDKRINPSHLDPTKGPFGGKCLPKDLDALIRKTEELGIENILLKAVKRINEITKKTYRKFK